jgi:putative ABC transport system ATP-binding protein
MIRTQGLAYAYAGGTALRFDDVLVPQGGVLLLKGPSGAGKSTWLALAAGLVSPSQGQIEVAGQVLAGGATDRWRARHIGFLPQKLHLRPAPACNLALGYSCFLWP